MIFGQTMAFKKEDSKTWDTAVLSEYGKKKVAEAERVIERSKNMNLKEQDWDWMKVDVKYNNK